MPEEFESEDTSRDDLILKELRLHREILTQHTDVLLEIQRELGILQGTQKGQGREVGSLGARVKSLEMRPRDRGGAKLTPVPEMDPKLESGSG